MKKSYNRSRTLTIVTLLLVTTITSWVSSMTSIEIRAVDYLKILANGVLIGVLISYIANSFVNRDRAD